MSLRTLLARLKALFARPNAAHLYAPEDDAPPLAPPEPPAKPQPPKGWY